jgi:hypothetical protein
VTLFDNDVVFQNFLLQPESSFSSSGGTEEEKEESELGTLVITNIRLFGGT